MTLYSPFFILSFFPAFAGLYNLLPSKVKTYALCAINLCFYCFAAGKFFFVLPALSVIAYVLSFLGRKGCYICLMLLPLLRFFNIGAVGISFFILRAAAYIYDEHREKNFFRVWAFLMFFPCVHAGPLMCYGDMQNGFGMKTDYLKISRGICLLLLGAVKKMFFADSLFLAFDTFYHGGTSLSALCALICYSLYIYFDFSGCSDMAIGIAACLGFCVPKNFDFPYMSRSVGEFFRRWHMSLGRWLFKYIYLPLGGSKNGKMRMVISLLAVWLFSALWHGTTSSYLLWGAWFFFLSVLEKFGMRIGRAGTLFSVLLGWVFFFSDSIADSLGFLKRLLSLGNTLLYSRADIYNFTRYAPFVLLAVVCATPLCHALLNELYRKCKPLVYVLAFPAFLFVLSCLAVGGHMPFLYASF